jgi:hypothetical protein
VKAAGIRSGLKGKDDIRYTPAVLSMKHVSYDLGYTGFVSCL